MPTLKINRHLIPLCYVLFLALTITAGSTYASTITPVGQQARFAPDHVSNVDFLFVAPPNSAGISVNRFSKFSVTDELMLSNTPGYNQSTGDAIQAAKTVVIIASNIDLNATINIVGPATDIVFLTDSNSGLIKCQSCVVNNALRLSLLSANAGGLDASVSELGTLTSSGTLSINSLYAPGSIGLDLVGKSTSVSGTININEAAMRASGGGYVVSPAGRYTMGTGGIDLVTGSGLWNYERRQIAKMNYSTSTQTIGGHFKAPRVHISSASHLKFVGQIDTRTDVISAVSYNGTTHIPQESAALQALSSLNSGVGVNLSVTGDIFSEGEITFRATGNAAISPSAQLNALDIQITAVNEVFNDGAINADYVSIAGEEVLNEGEIDAASKAQLWAQNDLANQYGGVIRADEIELTSIDAVVRNGSRTPYRTESVNRNNLLDFSKSDILGNYMRHTDSQDYFYDSRELGAFYLMPQAVKTSSSVGRTWPGNYSAHVIGGHIKIQAPAFENINPYYVRVDVGEQVLLERQRVSQVAVSAERLLEINGSDKDANGKAKPANYMLNASAAISVNSESAPLRVHANKIINQRYRVATYLLPFLRDEEDTRDEFTSLEYYRYGSARNLESEGFQSLTAVYSPPGFILALGPVEMGAADYFANVLGYIEFLNGLNLDSEVLKNFGLANQGFNRTTRTFIRRIGRDGFYEGSESVRLQLDPQELDSLFFVNGHLNAPLATGWFEELNPFLNFAVDAASDAWRDDYQDYTSQRFCTSCTRGGRRVTFNQTYEYDADVSSIYKDPNWLSEGIFQVQITENLREEAVEDFYRGPRVKTESTTTTETYSLLSVLIDFYQKTKDKFSEMLDEFNWWGLAE